MTNNSWPACVHCTLHVHKCDISFAILTIKWKVQAYFQLSMCRLYYCIYLLCSLKWCWSAQHYFNSHAYRNLCSMWVVLDVQWTYVVFKFMCKITSCQSSQPSIVWRYFSSLFQTSLMTMFVNAGLSVHDIWRDKIHHLDEVPYIKSAKRSDCHDAVLEVDVATCMSLLS